MNDFESLPDTMFTLSKSTPDSNKFYSILLDTRASTMSENMFDTAEKLLQGEKDNAKSALDHLWALKKNMQNQDEASTVDLLIQFYQNKIDILRNKEEHIKKISRDSRNLLEDKRKRDAEVATIKQEISDCSKELSDLSSKLEKLKIKEQELTLIEGQLKKELVVNENEIVNGLYEIIITNAGEDQPGPDFSDQMESAEAGGAAARSVPREEAADSDETGAENENRAASDAATPAPEAAAGKPVVKNGDTQQDHPYVVDEIALDLDPENPAEDDKDLVLYKRDDPGLPPVFPKSVVKTTAGRVVGEYYYDANAYKNKRHYIFNSKFFLEQLANSLAALRNSPGDAAAHADLLQMIQDAYKRISETPSMHFEIATNEILNEKTMKDLWNSVKSQDFHEATRFCKRLNAKIGALGSNYRSILKEQMTRYQQK
jgi:hypothetical protein